MIKRFLIPAALCAALAAAMPSRAESICADAGATNPFRSQVIAILPAEIQALIPDPNEVIATTVSPVVGVPTPPAEIVTPTVCVPIP